jgi:hypothetical protein
VKAVEEFKQFLKKLDQATLIKIMCEYDEYVQERMEDACGDYCPFIVDLEVFILQNCIHTVEEEVIYRIYVDAGH